MGHGVNFPHALPKLVLKLNATFASENACIGKENIHLAVSVFGCFHQGFNVTFDANIASDCEAAEFNRDGLGLGEVKISQDDPARTLGGEAASRGATNAARCTGHD